MGEIIHLNEEEVKSQLSERVRETVEREGARDSGEDAQLAARCGSG